MTNIIQQSPSIRGSISSASKRPYQSYGLQSFIIFYNSSPLVPIFSPINPVPTVPADLLKMKVKGKCSPRRAHEGPEKEQSYSSTLSLTSPLGEGGWTARGPGLFVPRKVTRYSLYRTLGCPQSRSGREDKILPLPGFILEPSNS